MIADCLKVKQSVYNANVLVPFPYKMCVCVCVCVFVCVCVRVRVRERVALYAPLCQVVYPFIMYFSTVGDLM